MCVINLLPGEVWEFYQKNATKLTNEMALIADSGAGGYKVYLTEDDGIPLITVTENGDTVYEEGTISEDDTTRTVSSIYKKYIYIDEDTPSDNSDREMFEAEIFEQEEVIRSAFAEFLSVVTNFDYQMVLHGFGAEISEMMDSVLLMLTNDYGVSVYRPMFVVNTDTGEEEFTEYPYDEYDF